MALNQGKLHDQESEQLKMLLRLYHLPEKAKIAGVLLLVLCSNKERQKHCIGRDLNQKQVQSL